MAVPWRSVTSANFRVSANRFSKRVLGCRLSNCIKTVGKIRNVSTRETAMPEAIIQPKLMMGRMLLSSRELKPAMVVSTMNRQGLPMESTVSSTISWRLPFGLAAMTSR